MDKYARYITLGVIIIVITLINVLLRKSLVKNKAKTEVANNIIRQPKQYLYAGMYIAIGSFLLAVIFLLLPKDIIVDYVEGIEFLMSSIWFLLSLVGVVFIILQLNWKIEIKENEFEFTNTFGKKRIYKFDEVEVRQLSRCTRFYKNKRHIVGISMLQGNYDALEKAIFRYKKALKKMLATVKQ